VVVKPINPQQRDDGSDEAGQKRLPSLDRIEFLVRFICGGLLGLWTALKLFRFLYHHLFLYLGVTIVLVLCSGFGAAKYGDRFWEGLFGQDRARSREFDRP
jgi:cell division protein FtsW (lipid II flippase)